LRIGYSSSFSLASTRHLGLAGIRAHDPGAVEVFAYRQRLAGGGDAPDLGPATRAIRDISDLDDHAAAAAIAADRLDLLVDLSGHTPGNRLGVFAERPVPVQATWIESFFTTGLAAVDWFITDREHSPEDLEQGLVEKPLRLDRPRFCYEPPADAPEVAPVPSRKNGYVTFGCFNYPPKLAPAVVEAWAAILKELPGARLRLKWWSMTEPAVAAAFRSRFAAHGIAAERLELSGASAHRDLLAEYGDIDVALDPFPFTGGVTTCEALWMGVPVVARTGRTVIERQSAALLTSVGAGDLVAASAEDYRRIALGIAEDEPGRIERRRSLRRSMRESKLTDGADMARALEAAYRRAVGADTPGT
jgi:predicted O-linked N-acetylglucosamine transferase (SPINDLY family)